MPKKPCSPVRPPRPKKLREARVEIVLPDGSKVSARGKAAEDLARRALTTPVSSPPGWHYGPNGWWYSYGTASLPNGGLTYSSTVPASYLHQNGITSSALYTSNYACASNSPREGGFTGSPIEDTKANKVCTSHTVAPLTSSSGSVTFTASNGKAFEGSEAVAAAEAALGAPQAEPAQPNA